MVGGGDGGGGDGLGDGGGGGAGEGGGGGGGGGSCGGAGDGGVEGNGGGDGLAQISSKSKPQPVPRVQPFSSSATVQSLAPASKQMAAAWAKFWFHAQPFPHSSDPPDTEQPSRSAKPDSLSSEQQRTWPRAAGHGQQAISNHARKRSSYTQARVIGCKGTHLVLIIQGLGSCSLVRASAVPPAGDEGMGHGRRRRGRGRRRRRGRYHSHMLANFLELVFALSAYALELRSMEHHRGLELRSTSKERLEPLISGRWRRGRGRRCCCPRPYLGADALQHAENGEQKGALHLDEHVGTDLDAVAW